MIKKFIVIIVSVLVLNTSFASACSLTCDFSEYTAMNAAVRSAVMPGWGQRWNEQKTKGWIVFGVFALSVFGAFYYNNKSQTDYERYEKLGARNSSLYDDYETDINNARILGVVAVATWIFAVADAYIVANKKSKLYAFRNIDIESRNDGGFMIKYKTKFSI